eukprot:7268137-Lingulodinium_polyedra.AAC.1
MPQGQSPRAYGPKSTRVLKKIQVRVGRATTISSPRGASIGGGLYLIGARVEWLKARAKTCFGAERGIYNGIYNMGRSSN